ncbi:MAG: AMP-binding protein [Cyanobacteria bacterium J06641_5]
MNPVPSELTRDTALDEQALMRRTADFTTLEVLSELWDTLADRYGKTLALWDPHANPEVKLTYTELAANIRTLATGLQSFGLAAGTTVGLIADNSPRWLQMDQAIMLAGAANAVRSAQAEREEALYILSHSRSRALVVENLEVLGKLQPDASKLPLEFIVLLSDETPPTESKVPVYAFTQVLEAGRKGEFQPVPDRRREDLATLIYTSGTTGKPKGAMLTHGNLLHQVTATTAVLQPEKGDRALSILPSWHAYERSCEYFLLSQGCAQIYTSLRSFKKDLQKYQPHYMVGVPRLWESVYDGIQKTMREQPESRQKLANFFFAASKRYIRSKRCWQCLDLENLSPSLPQRLVAGLQAIANWPLHALGQRLVYRKIRQATGGKLKTVFSGGGALARHLDDFYEIIGIPLLVGYGLTETAPITHGRRLCGNLRWSAGKPLPETAAKIVDPQTRQLIPAGEQGLVLLRGPQVMKGYFDNPEATAKAIDSEGWFDSGDLGWVTPWDDLILTGRAKDTIVLSNGENIEPQPIEDVCLRSPYIDQIVLVGQDRRSLGALIVPNFDALQQWAAAENTTLDTEDVAALNANRALQNLLRQELTREVRDRPGYRPDDRIGAFWLLLEPFSPENGLMTQTLKIKRPVVASRYATEIAALYD